MVSIVEENASRIGLLLLLIIAAWLLSSYSPIVFGLTIAVVSTFALASSQNLMTSKVIQRALYYCFSYRKTTHFGRECITCDGPGCTVKAPKKGCACHTVFYCSAACQQKHWVNEHKNYCIDINQMKLNMLKMGDGELPQVVGGKLKEGDNDCAICLCGLEDPYVLPSCGHAFCFKCLAEWQAAVKNRPTGILSTVSGGEKKETKLSCPACRAETPDVEDSILQRSRLLASRANNRKTPEHTKKNLRLEALAVLEQLETIRPRRPVEQVVLKGDVQAYTQGFFTRAEVLLALDQPEKAKEDLVWLLDLCKLAARNRKQYFSMQEHLGEAGQTQGRQGDAHRISEQIAEYKTKHNILSMEDTCFSIYAMLGKAEEKMGNWTAAKSIYFEMIQKMEHHTSATPPLQRMMFMGLCRCAYHLGRYDKAVLTGGLALQMNRSFPFVHKYIALSQKAMGDLDAAKVTMTRALIYEAPWDDQHHERLLELYREIVGESPELDHYDAEGYRNYQVGMK